MGNHPLQSAVVHLEQFQVLGTEEADDVLLEEGHLQQSEIEDDAAGAIYEEEGGLKRREVSRLSKEVELLLTRVEDKG